MNDDLVNVGADENALTSEKSSNVGEIAATSGAIASAGGIAAGVAGACAGSCALIATGSLVGGGIAIAPIAWAGAPAYLGAKAINHYAFKQQDTATESEEGSVESEEEAAREAARKATNIGAIVGIGATATITVSKGIKTSAVFAKLGSIGALIGAGPVAGGVILALIPIATAGLAGAGVYYAKKKFQKAGAGTPAIA